MRDGHVGVRLMNDYACDWPIWWAEGLQAQPEDLDLSADLEEKVRAWARHFDEHFDHLSRWGCEQAKQTHARLAREIEAELTAQIGRDLEVRTDLWELQD